MQTSQQNSCQQIQYIDCRNWMDFSEETIIILLAFTLFLRVNKHYRNLKKQKQDQAISEHQKSVRRKLRVNLIQIIYLGLFIFSTFYNMFLFTQYRNNRKFFQQFGWPQRIYKFTQILFVNWLNVLNVTVGFLYWKAARAFYVLSDLQVPKVYRRLIKVLFVGLFTSIFLTIVASLILLMFFDDVDSMVFKILTLLITSVSIFSCISCRILYRKHILSQIQLPQRAVQKEYIHSFLLLFSSLARIALYTLDIVGGIIWNYEWQSYLREQVQEKNGCIDNKFYYAFILLAINITVNLLPAWIYGKLFVSEIQTPKNQSGFGRTQLLNKASDD